jgi:hypothetical protein
VGVHTDALALPPVPPPAPADHPLRDRIIVTLFAIAVAWPGLALIGHVVAHDDAIRKSADGAVARAAVSRENSRPRSIGRSAIGSAGRDALVRIHHERCCACSASRASPR